MNYLELMVSAKPFLLVFIATRFKSRVNGPAGPGKMGQQDVWVVFFWFFFFQARSGVGVVCLRRDGCSVSKVEGCVDFMGVKVSVSRCFLPLSYLLLVSLDLKRW